jgi:hypothetical protein
LLVSYQTPKIDDAPAPWAGAIVREVGSLYQQQIFMFKKSGGVRFTGDYSLKENNWLDVVAFTFVALVAFALLIIGSLHSQSQTFSVVRVPAR